MAYPIDFNFYSISIHAAHAGCDLHFFPQVYPKFPFQSTQPMRAATILSSLFSAKARFQSTQPMRAATIMMQGIYVVKDISIHAAHAGCDYDEIQSHRDSVISIHAAHAGCDSFDVSMVNVSPDFNPRSPCGLRHFPHHVHAQITPFQSTQPMRAATASSIQRFAQSRISIHAAHAGCDSKSAFLLALLTKKSEYAL